MPALKGQILLNQYRVEEFIFPTPLGDLYRAVDIRSEKSFALTHIPRAIYENNEALKDLDARAVQLKSVSHPNLTPYLGFFQTASHAFFLEDWVDGPSLRDILILKHPLQITEAMIYINAICSALETLHKNKLLHLRLAPELIRLNKKGEIFLSGIGTAKQSGSIHRDDFSYPRLYNAPEQFSAEPLTSAADIYALAVILYQAVTAAWINGSNAPTSRGAIEQTHIHTPAPAPAKINPTLPDHFSRMIQWALRKKPEERFQTTTELLTSLALAAKISVDAIPRSISPESDTFSAKILSEWKFLPPPKLTSIAQDLPPLQERLAALEPQPKKKKTRTGFISAFIFLLIAGFFSLFWFVRPAPQQAIPTSFPTSTITPYAANITMEPSATPSPKPTDVHGGKIAFTCTRGDYNQICMINRDGTGFAQLTDMNASNYYPIFTPNGESLLFASNRNGAFDLYLWSFEKKEITQITQNIGNVISPDYSPDGRQIIFANRAGENPTAIWMVNSDGLNPRLVYQGTGNIVAVAWSPNGEKIAYAMSVGVPLEYEIFIMDINGKNHVRLTQGLQGIGGSLDWAPDGSHLLIYAGPYEDKDIFKLDAQTGNSVQLTQGGNNAGAAYSPDGKYIVFNSLRNDEQADLYIMRADGTNQTQLTNHPEPDWGAQWTK